MRDEATGPALRPEVLRFPRPDGGLDLVDPVCDRLLRLDAEEAKGLERLEEGEPEPALRARLETALLLEGPAAQLLRREWYRGRTHRVVPPPAPGEPAPPFAPLDAPGVASRWRDPEALRRLAEERRAGREVLVLRGFCAPTWTSALADAVRRLPLERLETPLVRAARARVDRDALPELFDLLEAPGLARTVSALLGVSLGPRLEVNAWRLGPGDAMGVHPDGPEYSATFSLGLTRDWTAELGGAIAFGEPTDDGLAVRERFCPHAGDLCLFAPSARSWHAVERVASGERWSITGWWTR
ncbi:MAG: 2OG-Fe(II) oxygenase [Planctomycetota bacterium]|nr:MAG: 2OG-Fe(II) oxygenase [Planctomycetota bacterium]